MSNTNTYERLLQKRIVFLGQEIIDQLAHSIIAQMLYLESQSPEKDIYLCINSPGGGVAPGMAIYDAMQHIKCDICTLNMGLAAGIAALLLAAGTHGKRLSLTASRIMINQPTSTGGKSIDLEIKTREVLRIKKRILEILANQTGQTVEKIAKDTEKDFFMSPQEALEYGLIDQIVGSLTAAHNLK